MSAMNAPGEQLGWRELLIPAGISEDAARSAVQSLAAMAGQPRVIVESFGNDGIVGWRIGADVRHLTRLTESLRVHLPGVHVEPLAARDPDFWQVDLAATARFAGDMRLPLRRDDVASAVRSLLGALSAARANETVRLQLVLGPRSRPTRAAITGKTRGTDATAMRKKSAEYTVGLSIRIAARASDEARSRSLINRVASAMRSLEAPGSALRLKRTSADSVSRAESPFMWSSFLGVSDIVALAGWPVGEPPLPGVGDPHPKLLPPDRSISQSGRPLGLATTSVRRGDQRVVALKREDALRHLHVIGPTGSGKSQLLGGIAVASMRAGNSVCVVDPKGQLVHDLLARVPEDRINDVVIVDPFDIAPVGLNPLHGDTDAERAADAMLGLFRQLNIDSWGPRTADILHASLISLARYGDGCLPQVPLLLTSPGFRRKVVAEVAARDPLGVGGFWSWYESVSEAERIHAISPLMNKLRPLLLRPGLRAIFGQRQPRFDIRELFSKPRILLVPLDKGRLGPEGADLLGTMVVSQIWDAAREQSLRNLPRRQHVDLIVDEVQDYVRLADVGEALAQARSMGLALTAAHQFLGQFNKETKEAFLANCRSRVMFQASLKDARELAPLSRGQVDVDDLQALPAFTAYAQLLVDGSPAPWTSLSTQLMPSASIDPERVRSAARVNYGRPTAEVEADLLSIIDGHDHVRSGRIGRSPRSSDGDDR